MDRFNNNNYIDFDIAVLVVGFKSSYVPHISFRFSDFYFW